MNPKFLVAFIATIFFLQEISFAQQNSYHPLRVSRNILLDGTLNDSLWSHAEVLNDFMQTDPNPGAAPTEKTEARILYNNEFLFVGIRCYDNDPSKIIRLHLQRDFPLGEDDGTAVVLDTYHDRNTSIIFISNTLNARWDSQFTNDGSDENDSYNTFWDVASNVDSLGYTTVYRIPFSSLRFESKPEVIMGLRISRLIKRKAELITCPKMDPTVQNGWANVSYAKDIVFENVKSHTPFYISPYAIANFSMQNSLNESGTAYEKQSEFMVRKNFVSNEALDKILSNIGADAKYGLSRNFTLDVTVNTDFAQAEVDDQIINLTKYDVNLPEKRSFFLESASNLTFSFTSGNEVFITRSIGNENGEIVPIIAGVRVTGKSHGWQIGTLDMQTTAIQESNIAPHNFFVFRTRRDIDRLGSFVGGIFTNRINTDSSVTSNQSIGFSILKRFNPHVSFLAAAAGTLTNFNFDRIGQSMYYNAGIFRNALTGFTYSATVDIVGKEFNPVMGYLDEPDHGIVGGTFGYQYPAKGSSKAEYWYLNTNDSYRWFLSSGRPETVYSDLVTGVSMKDGTDIHISLFELKMDSLTYDWYLDDHNAIAAGTYRTFNNTFSYTLPNKYNFGGNFTATYGGFYGGKRIYFSPDVIYNINRHFHVGLTYEYNHISFSTYLNEPTPTLYQTNLIRLRFAYLVSTKISFILYTQFDDLSHTISSNLRFRFNPKEGTDLYIVINQGLNTDRNRLDPHLPAVDSQAITIKFIKTFEL